MEEAFDRIYSQYLEDDGNIISILQDVEETFGYIPPEAIAWFSAKLSVPASSFYGIATFYNQFHLSRRGKNVITFCSGTACHVRGAHNLINRMRQNLAIAEGEDTSEDGEFTVDEVACVGACGISPVALVNKKIHGHMSTDKANELIEWLLDSGLRRHRRDLGRK